MSLSTVLGLLSFGSPPAVSHTSQLNLVSGGLSSLLATSWHTNGCQPCLPFVQVTPRSRSLSCPTSLGGSSVLPTVLMADKPPEPHPFSGLCQEVVFSMHPYGCPVFLGLIGGPVGYFTRQIVALLVIGRQMRAAPPFLTWGSIWFYRIKSCPCLWVVYIVVCAALTPPSKP